MKTSTTNTTSMENITFTHDGYIFVANANLTYCWKWPEGCKGERTRIKKGEFESARKDHNEENRMEKIDKAWNGHTGTEDPLADAAEDPTVSVEEFCEMIEGRKVTGSDLQVPAIINEHGCVDCSKCNAQNCPHRECFRRNPRNVGGIAECPRLKVKAEEPTVEPETPKAKKSRKSKDIAFTYSENGETIVTLTAKQVDFVKHLPDTCFWENGLDSTPWVDVLCDEIKGQFAGKPMTVGAMVSTLCEKGLMVRGKMRVNKHLATYIELTELGKTVFTGWGLE